MELKKKMIFTGIAVVLLGIVLGCFLQPQGGEYAEYVRLMVHGKTTLFAAIVSNTVFVAAVFLLGYFTFGFVLIYPLLFFKAYTAGVMASLCITIYGAYGIVYTVVYIFPVFAITLVLMTLLAAQSFTFSLSMLFGGEKKEVLNNLLHQTVFGAVFVTMSGFAVVWASFLSPVVAMVI